MEVYLYCKCLVLHKDHQNNKPQWLHVSFSEVCVFMQIFSTSTFTSKKQKTLVKCSRAVP